jgi:hypothetical protein
MFPARTQMPVTIALLAMVAAGCKARSPFEEQGPVAIRVARLAPYERRGSEPLPAEIEKWLAAGASQLPADLVPPGLLVAGTPLPRWEPDAPTFLSFHEIESRKTSETMARDFLGWARDEAGDEQGAPCMYPEFGLDITRGGGTPDAQVLVSLACGQARVFVSGQAPQDLGMSKRARAHFAGMVARVFRSAPS